MSHIVPFRLFPALTLCGCIAMLFDAATAHSQPRRRATQVSVPRLVAPISGGQLTSLRPAFRVEMPAAPFEAMLEICRDRQCAQTLATVLVLDGMARPPSDLPVGVFFWRVTWSGESTPTWVGRIMPRAGSFDTVQGVIRDINGDGIADIVSESEDGTVVMWAGGPNGPSSTPTFARRLSVAASSWGRVEFAGDVNGDGFGDVLHGDGAVLAGTPTGLSAEPLNRRLPLARGPRGPGGFLADISEVAVRLVPIGDIDRDGHVDACFAWSMDEYAGCTIRTSSQACPYPYAGLDLGLGTVQGYRARSTLVGAGVPADRAWWVFGSQAAGDIDADGLADVVTEGKASVSVAFGDATATRLPTQVIPGRYLNQSPEYVRDVVTGDFNGDGANDVVTFDGSAIWTFVGGTRTLRPARPLRQADVNALFASGDFDGDGFGDLLGETTGADGGSVSLVLFRGSAEGLSVAQQIPAISDPGRLLLVGDFNGDGRDDFATSGVQVFLSNGSSFGRPLRLNMPPTASNAIPAANGDDRD